MGMFSSDTKANPFKDAEERMHDRMMKAEGSNPDQTFAMKMVEHHRGAIEAGQILLQEGSDPELQSMARKSIEEQQDEIAELEDWLSRHGSTSA